MVRSGLIGVAVLWMSAAVLDAQPIPAGRQVGLAEYLRFGYGGLKHNLQRAAERMPEADYDFRPSDMSGVRGFGRLFAHVAEGQFDACAAVAGVPNPMADRRLELELDTKEKVLQALGESFELCDAAFAALTDANAGDLVRRGQGEISRSAMLVGVLAHGSEMYGVSTVYLRAKGFVPPSSER